MCSDPLFALIPQIEIVQEEVDEQQWELLQAGDAGNQVHVVDATDESTGQIQR